MEWDEQPAINFNYRDNYGVLDNAEGSCHT